jgi:hypothetical protein
MAFFSALGLFALFVLSTWLIILLVLFAADIFWTHGLSGTYVNSTGLVLQQVWNFFSFLLNLVQRIIALAPRGLQILFFLLLGVFGIGLVMNWMMASNVVCVGGVPLHSDNLIAVWMAKSLDSSIPPDFNATLFNGSVPTNGKSAFVPGGGSGAGGGGGDAG